MKITFYSNYLTHHQIPFCDAMAKHDGVEFRFVATMPMESERVSGGWALQSDYAYELRAYASPEAEAEAMRIARESDVVMVGSAPERYVAERMKHGTKKLTFRYSERIYKGGYWKALSPRGLLMRCKTYFRYLGKPLYMLCASAYTAGDLALLGSYLGKCYKWGYFPAVKRYEDIDRVMDEKPPASVVWVARFIDLKHPEVAIRVTKRLRDAGYAFELNMIGNGEMMVDMQALVAEEDLQDCVHLLGAMSPDEVRAHMEKSRIFLFTSDRHEGWGAVLNEAMNSGCAVVASNAIGSVPFMIRDGKNGYMYPDGDEDALYERVKYLLDNPDKCREIGMAAYKTMTEMWNAEVAADRLLHICTHLVAEDKEKQFYADGVCSKAPVIIGKAKTHAHIDRI